MIHGKQPAVSIVASTTSANIALIPLGSAARYIRVVNGSATSLGWVNIGGASVTALNSNIPVAPMGEVIIERDPVTDTHIACLLASGGAHMISHFCGAD